MTAKLKKEIFAYFKQTQPVYLATNDGNEPRVRPVTLIWFEEKFWIATGSSDAKVKQLFSNVQFFNDFIVAVDIFIFKVIKKIFSFPH